MELKGAVNPGSVWENRDGEWVCVDPGQGRPRRELLVPENPGPAWLVDLLGKHRVKGMGGHLDTDGEFDSCSCGADLYYHEDYDAHLASLIWAEAEDRAYDAPGWARDIGGVLHAVWKGERC